MTDIVNAFEAIKNKRPIMDELFRYVEGGQPLKYSTERLREAFDDITARFEINWCNVVVETTLDRLSLLGFKLTDDAMTDALNTIFSTLHIGIESDEAHRACLTMTQGYIIAWRNDDGIEIYYNDPRMCQVFYDPARPKVKQYAAKWFMRSDKHHEITLYYPERIEHWVTKSSGDHIDNVSDFALETSEPNPFGVIPVFELKTPGEITKVITLQDAINKTFADMMVAAEYGAFMQRWVISNSDPGDLRNGPNQIWWIPSGDGEGQASSVGQFSPTDLGNYLDAMDKLANAMAIITRTPKHYLTTTGANLSGEALMTMEAPLVKKVQARQKVLTPIWQEIAQFLLLLSDYSAETQDITVLWGTVESVQPYTQAQTRQLAINSGVPLITQLRREGWTQAEIDAMVADMQAQRENTSSLAQSVLNAVRVRNEQSNQA